MLSSRLAVLGFTGLLGACMAGDVGSLKRTADGTTRVGRHGQTFRIVAHGIDLRMQAPAQWRVILCTEEPLSADVVCAFPDKKSAISVKVTNGVGLVGSVDAPPEESLRQLHRFADPEIQMRRDSPFMLPDGRRVAVWRFYSTYWGEHLATNIDHGSAIVHIEVESRAAAPDLSMIRDVFHDFLRSYRTNQAMERTVNVPHSDSR